MPEQSSHLRTLVESESESVGGREHKILEKHPLGLFSVLKAIQLLEEHVLCVNLEVNRKVPFILSILKQ